MRALLIAAMLALAGCQLQEPTLPGTVVAVTEAELPENLEEDLEDSARHYESPLVPEVAWKVDVRLDDGSEVTVIQNGGRPEPGERVRLLKDSNGELFL
jgi:outer membrane lipoprotein SlyB